MKQLSIYKKDFFQLGLRAFVSTLLSQSVYTSVLWENEKTLNKQDWNFIACRLTYEIVNVTASRGKAAPNNKVVIARLQTIHYNYITLRNLGV